MVLIKAIGAPLIQVPLDCFVNSSVLIGGVSVHWNYYLMVPKLEQLQYAVCMI